jgi:phosphohistidine swiveling domain-containing protein
MTTNDQTGYVLELADPQACNPNAVGMKAATLARLIARSFRVPQGFVVTAVACEKVHSGGGIPPELSSEIRSHLDRLGQCPLAVRSSGLAEDLPDASYAGQYESVLGVVGNDAVSEAIAHCVASASSARVRAYQGAHEPARMAVIVQRMVSADAAGVAFTANPVTGDREVLVSAVKGLGDRLVGGEATPDEWIVRGEDVTCARSPEGALDQERAREIAALATSVEDVFGAPQDIEWALADGSLFLLQARPITALPVAPHIQPPSEGYWQKDTSHWPVPLTPFGASVYLPALSDAKTPMAEFGLMIDGVVQRSFGGEVYFRIVPLGGKDRPAPPAWVMKLGLLMAPPLRRRARDAKEALASDLAEQLLDRWDRDWRPAFKEEFRELRGVQLTTLSDDALLAHLDRADDMLRRGTDLHFRLTAPYHLGLYELGVICQEFFGWDFTRTLLLLSGSSVASSEPGRELRALAERVAVDQAALRAITEPGGDRLTALRTSAPWVATALDDYLEHYGHRTLNYDPGEPTMFERPDMVVAMLAELAGNPSAASDHTDGRADALTQARSALADRSEEDRARFDRALAYAQRAYAQREDNVIWCDGQPSALLRYAAVEIGRRLVERNELQRATDAVFLEVSELRGALARKGTNDLPRLVARRKAERAWVIAHPGPPSYGPVPSPPPPLSLLPPAMRIVHTALLQSVALMMAPDTAQDGSNELRGVPGSPGHYSGTVRVVRDETEFSKLGQGDVLVAPVTSPPWSVLFLQAGAVVTDGGGVLSHTAVIAREYNIPAVLATGVATGRLRDGDVVTVDGARGVVTIGAEKVDLVR